jgi:hypothetical protein
LSAVFCIQEFLGVFAVELDQFGRRWADWDGRRGDIRVSVGELAERIAVVENLNNGIGVTGVSEL